MIIMHVGIIGCGLIGFKRAASLPKGYLCAVADVDLNRAKQLAQNYPDCEAYSDWMEILTRNDIDAVGIDALEQTEVHGRQPVHLQQLMQEST